MSTAVLSSVEATHLQDQVQKLQTDREMKLASQQRERSCGEQCRALLEKQLVDVKTDLSSVQQELSQVKEQNAVLQHQLREKV